MQRLLRSPGPNFPASGVFLGWEDCPRRPRDLPGSLLKGMMGWIPKKCRILSRGLEWWGMSAEQDNLVELIQRRREGGRILARRLAISFVLFNFAYFVFVGIVLSNVAHSDQDDVAPFLFLGWVAMNFFQVSWTRKRSRPARVLAAIDVDLARSEDPEGSADSRDPDSGSSSELESETGSGAEPREGRRFFKPVSARSQTSKTDSGSGSGGEIGPEPKAGLDPKVHRGSVRSQESPPPFLLRTIYFLFVGWWLGTAWGYLALVFCILILPLSAGQWMFRQMPQVMTLGVASAAPVAGGASKWSCPFLLRALYFLFVGSWFSVVCYHVGLLFCLLLFPISIGQKIFRSMPTLMTLQSPAAA